ncbi:MAG: FAD-binding oxidoreductase [Dongiaceae bacterium]
MPINPIDLGQPGAAHVSSFWAATAGPSAAPSQPVEGDLDVDIAIVGGGYTGLSTAYHLARDHGIKAHVLEANRVGWGCSGRNGGFCSAGIGKEDYGTWIARWGIEQTRRIYAMSREAVELVDSILTREQIDADRTPTGGLELAHRPNRLDEMAARCRFLTDQFGIEARMLGRDELERDYLVSREAHGAMHVGEGFGLHALRYANGLARAAIGHGAVIHEASPVLGWKKDGERYRIATPRGTVRAREIVVATNGYTNDELSEHLRGRLLPALSSIIVTRPLTEAERASVNWKTHLKIWDSRRLVFYYRLLPDNRILFGSRGGIEDTPESNAERRRWMVRRLAEMFPPLARVDIEHFWHGWVCVSYDRNPHFGTLPYQDGVHYALAYIGSGVALATYAGNLLARRIAGQPVDYGPLLSRPLPLFPFPAFRRTWQRLAYAWYGYKDEHA